MATFEKIWLYDDMSSAGRNCCQTGSKSTQNGGGRGGGGGHQDFRMWNFQYWIMLVDHIGFFVCSEKVKKWRAFPGKRNKTCQRCTTVPAAMRKKKE